MSTHPDAVKASDVEPTSVETTYVRGKSGDYGRSTFAEGSNGVAHGVPELMDGVEAEQQVSKKKKEWFGYLKTKQFWIVLLAG
jgi:solute carrier family 35 protein F1/2